MTPSPPTEDSTAKKAKLERILEEIAAAVKLMKLAFAPPELSPGFNRATPVSELARDIERNLRLLHAKARLGEPGAASALRSAGVQAAGFLEELAMTSEDRQGQIDHFPCRFREPAISMICTSPMTHVTSIIERELKFIGACAPAEIDSVFQDRISYDYDMYFSTKLLTYFLPPDSGSPSLVDAPNPREFVESMKEMICRRPLEEKQLRANVFHFCGKVNNWMGTEYVRILRASAAKDAQECARSSLRWPVAVSA